MLTSFLILGLSLILFLAGLFLGLGGNYSMKNLAVMLIYAPVYLPLLSFTIYLSGHEKST